jgi:aspartate/methionine/tyrosine aminotransferase
MKELVGKYAHLWETKGGIFSLAQGVVYWEPPQSCQDALIDALKQPHNLLHTYGPAQGIPELTQALEHKIAKENSLTNHDVMVTVGANQAFVNCVLTCLCDQSKAVVFRPYYFNHVMALQMCCGDDSVVVGPCSADGIPDVAWLQETLQTQRIDMVTIVNPGNPTGVSLSKEYLQPIVDLCEHHATWLVLDCTYEYFTTPADHQPLATFPDAPHVIHIFSFSKSYALAGYRCGYLVLHKNETTTPTTTTTSSSSSSSSLLTNMLKVQDTLPIGPPRISQIAALGALQAGQEWVRTQYGTLDESRQFILESLAPLPMIMGGTGAMYVMAQLPKTADGDVRDDVEFCRQLVEEHGIAIIPGTFCGVPGWIRVCYANLTPDVCQQAAQRLRNGIQRLI